MNGAEKSIMLVGESGTGKTHYGGQLLIRLNEGEGKLRIQGAAKNISPYEEAMTKLGQGVLAEHTPSNTYKESIFPIESVSGFRTNLVWPDYAGEQISHMTEMRRINKAWRQRVTGSHGWILFIRLDRIREYEDLLSRPLGEINENSQQVDNPDFKWSSQAVYVELIQLLLFTKGVGTVSRIKKPALTVILSCWDEMVETEENVVPDNLLRDRMPLFADFLSATWHREFLSIFGLSALGKPLKKDEPDAEYLMRGPESFGFIVLPDGRRSPDLTLPVSNLMEQIA